MLKFKNILVSIDFSKTSQKALDYAVPLAKLLDAKITLLHAIEPTPYPVEVIDLPPMSEDVIKNKLDTVAKNAIESEILNEVIVRLGTAFQVTANAARDCQADLIVITTHGYTGIRHVFMGSTAERVVRHAP
jgi:universal stress protein A